jgi:predicted metal-dependent peptidase
MEMFHNIPLIEPLEYKESFIIEEFVIAIDTSGSCSEGLITRFVEQTFHILKSTESYGRKLKLHIIQCDNEVKEDILIEDLDQLKLYQENFEIKGFGGTDYRPVFTYVDQLHRERQLTHLKGLLYFTDGYGIFPEKRTDYETAFIFIGEEHYEGQVPPWAMKLVLDPKDLS